MRYFLIILVFVSGMTSLALEMCASRLLAAYFGTSLFIWASVIGLILVYLTVGYFIGGRLADRYPSEQVLCTITAMAALSISILPFIRQGILTWSITGLAQASKPGAVDELVWAGGAGEAQTPDLRVESAVAAGSKVTPYYDPMIAKVIARGDTRAAAIDALDRALAGTTIAPCVTNLAFLRKVLADPAFREGKYDTKFAEALAKRG